MIYIKKGSHERKLGISFHEIFTVDLKISGYWFRLQQVPFDTKLPDVFGMEAMPQMFSVKDGSLFFFPCPDKRYACEVTGSIVKRL